MIRLGGMRSSACRGRVGWVVALSLLALVSASPARAQDRSGPDTSDRKGFCSRPFTARSAFASESSQDLYNALLWMGGTAAVQYGTRPQSRWTSRNDFDTGIRNGLRLGSSGKREDADTASDVMLAASIGLVPAVSVGKTLAEGECHEAWDMTTDALESFALSVFLTEAMKSIAGRERPFVKECDGTPPSDADCSSRARKQSFWSGHAATAGAGAGVACSYAIKRRTWGESASARALPCALGAGFAVTTGALRIAADKHWTTDVVVGLAVGATVGYFDTWGPFDWLRFEARADDRRWQLQGVVLPYAGDGVVGARVGLSY